MIRSGDLVRLSDDPSGYPAQLGLGGRVVTVIEIDDAIRFAKFRCLVGDNRFDDFSDEEFEKIEME